MTFTSLPSISSIYETAEVCSTEPKTAKSISSDDFITVKASLKVESVSDYIMAPVCESEPTSPFAALVLYLRLLCRVPLLSAELHSERSATLP